MAVTLQQVAKEADVSVSTVSKALNGKGKINPETREHILKVARRLGYPLPGKIYVLCESAKVAACVQKDYYAGICAELGNANHVLASIESLEGFLGDVLQREIIEGVIAFGIDVQDDPMVMKLVESGVKCVMINRRPPVKEMGAVMVNDETLLKELTEHLMEHGHKSIAYVCQYLGMGITFAVPRVAGYLQAMRAASLKPRIIRPVGQERLVVKEERPHALARRVLDLYPQITAVVAGNDHAAMAVIEEAQRRGIRVPEDLAVTGYDDLEEAKGFSPPLTTVEQPAVRMGEVAVKLLRQMNVGEVAGVALTLPGRIVYRRSCGCK